MSNGLTKIRAAIHRGKRLVRTFRGADWWPQVDRSVRRLRLGDDGAAWTVAPDYLDRNSVVWSVGVGENISFDVELHHRFGVQIQAFDPTPRSCCWLQSHGVPDWFHFHPLGLAGYDGRSRFRAPANTAHVSYAILEDKDHQGDETDIIVEVRCLATLATALGQREIDLLKMDIEGAEYGVFDTLPFQGIFPRQLLVEFHHRHHDRAIAQTIGATHKLQSLGYRLFDVSPNGEEYAFLHAEAEIK